VKADTTKDKKRFPETESSNAVFANMCRMSKLLGNEDDYVEIPKCMVELLTIPDNVATKKDNTEEVFDEEEVTE
jgi:hypothetical protein